jgi:hypothetical protein
MIQLTNEDCKFFEKAMLNRFTEEVLVAIKHDVPNIPDLTGDVALRSVIAYGINKAKTYGITEGVCVKDYIYVMHSNMGTRFDEDPIHRAARNILDSTITDESEKISRLKQHAKNYSDNLFEWRKRFASKTTSYMRKAKVLRLKSAPAPFEELKQHIMGEFHDKYGLIASSYLDTQIAMTRKDLAELGIQTSGCQAVICMLSFLFGFRLYNDAALPEIAFFFQSKNHTEEQKMQYIYDALNRKLKNKIAVMKQLPL